MLRAEWIVLIAQLCIFASSCKQHLSSIKKKFGFRRVKRSAVIQEERC